MAKYEFGINGPFTGKLGTVDMEGYPLYAKLT